MSSIPNWVVPASVLNGQSSVATIQATIAGENTPVPIIYGPAYVGGRIFTAARDDTTGVWTVGYVLALGEINAHFPANTYYDGAAFAGIDYNVYLGTTSQTADPLLSAAISGYSDDLIYSHPAGDIGIAYIVIQYTDAQYRAPPKLVTLIQGRKVYDPFSSAPSVYTAIPALHLRDLITSEQFGLGELINDTSVGTVRADNVATVIAESRRIGAAVLDVQQDTRDWIQTLAAYAGCWAFKRGDTWQLVSDRPRSVDVVFTKNDILEGSFKLQMADSIQVPTIVRVAYTDSSTHPYREREAVAPTVLPTIRRESFVRMPGIVRYSQAKREAEERLAKLQRSVISCSFISFDENIDVEVGDRATITHPYGLNAADMRITEAEPIRGGRMQISAVAYSSSDYNDTEASTPSWGAASQSAGIPGGSPTLVNILPPWLGDFETTQRSDVRPNIGGAVISLDTSVKYTGTRSIKISGTQTSGNDWGFSFTWFNFLTSTYRSNIFFKPNRRFLCIVALRGGNSASVTTNVNYSVSLRTPADAAIATSGNKQLASSGGFLVTAFEIDAQSASNTEGWLKLHATNTTTLGAVPSINADAMMLFDVTDSPWITESNFQTEFTPANGSPGGQGRELQTVANIDINTSAGLSANNFSNWSAEPASLYVIEGDFSYTSGVTPQFKFDIGSTNAPQSSSAYVSGIDAAGAAISLGLTNLHTTAVVLPGHAAGTGIVNFRATVLTHATLESILSFRWAQNVSDGGTTRLIAGARISCRRVLF